MKIRYQIRNELNKLVGCALSALLLMGAMPWTSALAADEFTDINGLQWISTGEVHYSDGPMTEPIEGLDEYRAESNLVNMSLEDVTKMYEPYMEINGVEYRLPPEQAEEFATKVFRMIQEGWSVGVEQQSQRGTIGQKTISADQDPSGDVMPRAVFGSDERYKIQEAHRQPYTRIAKTWSTSNNGACTAFKAYNHHTAITAAHCVHDGGLFGGGWRTRHQIQFAAGSDGLGQAKNPLPSDCYGRVVPGGWVWTRARRYDYAVLFLHGRGGAWCNYADYNVGYYGYKIVTGNGISGYVAGYPDAATSPNGSWGDLWYAARSDAYQVGKTIRHTIDTTFGQSGSPFATRTDDATSQFMGIDLAGTPDFNIASRVQSAMITFIQKNAGY